MRPGSGFGKPLGAAQAVTLLLAAAQHQQDHPHTEEHDERDNDRD